MKRIITFICALGAVVLLTDLNTYAQGRSIGRGPTDVGSQSTHGPDTDHGKSADHRQDADHRKANSDTDTKGTHKNTIADQIQHDTTLNAKVATLLPAGTDLATASDGFKNKGQFIAALHVSRNLNIPFADLKAKMTGTAPNSAGDTKSVAEPKSLGAAIQDLKQGISPEAAKTEVEKAERQAKADEKKTQPTT